jgi:hypothetical protein
MHMPPYLLTSLECEQKGTLPAALLPNGCKLQHDLLRCTCATAMSLSCSPVLHCHSQKLGLAGLGSKARSGWTPEEEAAFAEGLRVHDRDFCIIRVRVLPAPEI